jgi:hypothetical protein
MDSDFVNMQVECAGILLKVLVLRIPGTLARSPTSPWLIMSSMNYYEIETLMVVSNKVIKLDDWS